MKINVEFFKSNIIDSISSGIYKIIICKDQKEEILYIGESKSIIVRCAQHLLALNKNPEYFGFDKTTIEDASITLKFETILNVMSGKSRKATEKDLIKKFKPLSQSGRSDYMKNTKERIESVNSFLKKA